MKRSGVEGEQSEPINRARRKLLRISMYAAPAVLGTMLTSQAAAQFSGASCNPNLCNPYPTCSPGSCLPTKCLPNPHR